MLIHLLEGFRLVTALALRKNRGKALQAKNERTLRSRWQMPREWQKSTPLMSCWKKKRAWGHGGRMEEVGVFLAAWGAPPRGATGARLARSPGPPPPQKKKKNRPQERAGLRPPSFDI